MLQLLIRVLRMPVLTPSIVQEYPRQVDNSKPRALRKYIHLLRRINHLQHFITLSQKLHILIAKERARTSLAYSPVYGRCFLLSRLRRKQT